MPRERAAEPEPQRIARAHDEGAIKRRPILAPIASATGQSGAQGLDLDRVKREDRLRPQARDEAVTVSGQLKW